MGVPQSWSGFFGPVKILASALNFPSAPSQVKCHFDLSPLLFSIYGVLAPLQIMVSAVFGLQPPLLLAAASQFRICSKSRAAFQTVSSYPGSTISQTWLKIYKQSHYLPNAFTYAENMIVTFVPIISSNAFKVSIFWQQNCKTVAPPTNTPLPPTPMSSTRQSLYKIIWNGTATLPSVLFIFS